MFSWIFNGGRHAAVHLDMGQRYEAPRQGGKPHDRWQGETPRRQLGLYPASMFDPGNLDEYGNFLKRRHRTDGLSPPPTQQSRAERRAELLILEQQDREKLELQAEKQRRLEIRRGDMRVSRRQDLQTAYKEQEDLDAARP